jgi:Protein of unknown function (DUF2752)
VHLSRRHLRPAELDHELVWLSISLGSLGMAVLWLGFGLPWPHCAFHDLTGWPCLTCGATRAAVQFFHANFLYAWEWNPLVFAGLCAVLVFDTYAAFVLVTGRPRLRIAEVTPGEKNLVRIIFVALVALNWIYVLSHSRSYS